MIQAPEAVQHILTSEMNNNFEFQRENSNANFCFLAVPANKHFEKYKNISAIIHSKDLLRTVARLLNFQKMQ